MAGGIRSLLGIGKALDDANTQRRKKAGLPPAPPPKDNPGDKLRKKIFGSKKK